MNTARTYLIELELIITVAKNILKLSLGWYAFSKHKKNIYTAFLNY